MVGEYIALKRKDLNIKRKDLAKQLNISYSYLTLIETNKRKISQNLIPSFAKALKVKEDEINFYNSTSRSSNGFKAEQELVKKQIYSINQKLVKIKTDEIVLKKEREVLCKKLARLNDKENELKENLEEE